MGNMHEPRKSLEVAVRVFGTDRDGRPFFENVTTTDVSQRGAKLRGLRAKLQVDEVIGLTYGANKARFKVKWIGAPGTPAESLIGVLNLSPDKPLWDFPLPPAGIDDSLFPRDNDRRRWPRVKCSVSTELRVLGQAVIWARASDLSLGGCFVELAIPLPIDTRFAIALWLGESKLHLHGQVASLAAGFGNGVRFLGVSSEQHERLDKFIATIQPPEPAEATTLGYSPKQ